MPFSAKIVIMQHLRKMKLVLLLSQMNLRMPTSTRQAPDKLHTDNANVKQLVSTINGRQLSVKEMLSEMGLKDRESFLKLYLSPAIGEGFVRMLHPESPRHPRQKYLLTAKGLALSDELKSKEQ